MKTKIYSIICVICLLFSSSFVLSSCDSSNVIGIANAQINENGELILIYSDGNEQNLGVVVGKDGADGSSGKDGVDGDTILGSHGKIEIVDGKVIHYDANGNRVPLSILDY